MIKLTADCQIWNLMMNRKILQTLIYIKIKKVIRIMTNTILLMVGLEAMN